MSFFKEIKTKYHDYMVEHTAARRSSEFVFAFIILSISAFLFAVGYKCFMVPAAVINTTVESNRSVRLVAGGIGGISQTIILGITLIPNNFIQNNGSAETVFYSILYFGINVPIILLAFFGIGKRFALYTIINVAQVSLWTWVLAFWDDGWVGQIALFAHQNGGMLSRALFAGACTGLSSALAFKVDGSAGGIDVIACFIALKKSKLVGKYAFVINAITVCTFTILGTIKLQRGLELPISNSFGNSQYLGGLGFSILYMMTTVLIIDMINIRNKKLQVEVVTDNEDLVNVIIANIPHGATVEKGFGAFTHKEKTIIQIVISSYEEKELIKVIKEADPQAFVKVVELRQVYGKFFLPVIK